MFKAVLNNYLVELVLDLGWQTKVFLIVLCRIRKMPRTSWWMLVTITFQCILKCRWGKKKKVKVLPFTVCCLQNNRNFWGLCLVHLSVYFFLCIRILSHLLLNSHHIVFRYLEIDAPDLLKLFSLVYSPQGVAIVSLLTQQASVI